METTTNQASQIDLMLDHIVTHFTKRSFKQSAILTEISEEMLNVAAVFYECRQIKKANELIVSLCNWIKNDLDYFISFKGPEKKMYEWDIVSSLQMLDHIIDSLEKHHQFEIANKVHKDYCRYNIQYSIACGHVRLTA